MLKEKSIIMLIKIVLRSNQFKSHLNQRLGTLKYLGTAKLTLIAYSRSQKPFTSLGGLVSLSLEGRGSELSTRTRS